jgi:hypothetical protein
MCTSITYVTGDHYFGRNFDYEISYDEVVTITPRNYKLVFRKVNNLDTHYAMIGIADYPLYYDATKEKGLSMAGLNFSGYADYKEIQEEKDNAINALNEDGTFNINTKNAIKAPTDKVELQLIDANKLAVGNKVPITVQKNDYKLKIDDYTLGDAKVTGTFDSRYTTDKDQIQLVIDGTVTKQVVYKAADTNPGKENEAFTIVVKGLITDKNQKVVVRHMKDGEVVVEKDLTIK